MLQVLQVFHLLDCEGLEVFSLFSSASLSTIMVYRYVMDTLAVEYHICPDRRTREITFPLSVICHKKLPASCLECQQTEIQVFCQVIWIDCTPDEFTTMNNLLVCTRIKNIHRNAHEQRCHIKVKS